MEGIRDEKTQAIILLKQNKKKLTRQQYKTLLGQIHAGDITGAEKGLRKLLLGGGSNAIKLH